MLAVPQKESCGRKCHRARGLARRRKLEVVGHRDQPVGSPGSADERHPDHAGRHGVIPVANGVDCERLPSVQLALDVVGVGCGRWMTRLSPPNRRWSAHIR